MGTRGNSLIILIDADVISHFISGGLITMLPTIFPYPIKILDKVYAEVIRMPGRKQEVDNLINFKMLEKIAFPDENLEVRKEYAHIKKWMFKGDGEAACLAVVRYSKDILASSNLKDIVDYCKRHEITYLTTMDFLCEAMKRNLLTQEDCDGFITRVTAARSKLPVKRMADFKCRDLDQFK